MVRTISCIVALASLVMLIGCVDLMSVHPLATNETTVLDTTLVGEWVHSDEDGVTVAWIRQRSPSSKDYDILWIPAKPDEAPLRLNGRLVRIGDRLIFDLVKTERPEMAVPGHFFMLVDKQPDQLRLGWLDSEWLRGRVVAQSKLTHVMVDGKPVVTAQSAEVAAFLSEFGFDPKAVSDTITLKRAKRG